MKSDNNNKKSWLQKKLEDAEKIQKALNFCRTYKGDDKEVIEWCNEFRNQFWLGMARGVTNHESFYDNNNVDGDGTRKKFRADSIW